MTRMNRKTNLFLRSYTMNLDRYKTAAEKVKELINAALSDSGVDILQVTARVKELGSLKVKLRKKKYSDPSTQLTDVIGVRVITHYESDVNGVVNRLKREFRINKDFSVDKRSSLGVKEFDYRSVHLIAQLKGSRERSPENAVLKDVWFEIQVRSILEHAWAVIDHEVIYKSGVNYPAHILRRFAAIAGVLELLEHEFLVLRKEYNNLIEHYREQFVKGTGLRKKLDSARLLGLLEQQLPYGLSWRKAAESGQPFPSHIEASCVDALDACGVRTGTKLVSMLKSRKFKAAARRFASNKGISTDEISHLASVAIAVGSSDKRMIKEFFEEMSEDPSIISALGDIS